MKNILAILLLLSATVRAAPTVEYLANGVIITSGTDGSYTITVPVNRDATITTSGTGRLRNGTGVIFSGTDSVFVDNTILRADGTSGKVQKSGVTIDDTNGMVVNGITSTAAMAGTDYFGSSRIGWAASTRMLAPANGNVLLVNSSSSDFSLMQFGGTTSSFPALKRVSTGFQVRLADDSALGPLEASNVTSGTYTPTLTNVTNVTASTAYQCQYMRVGNTVTVSGKVDIDVTLAAGAASELGVSLPVASAFTAEENLGGTAASPAAASLVSAIKADATNDRAAVVFSAISLNNDSYFFEFSYVIK